MKRTALIISVLFVLSLALGCQSSKSRAPEGAVIGGVLGAIGGGVIGHQSGHGGEGAAIGAAVGAATGAVVGAQIDKPAQTTAVATQMSIQEVIDMSRQGVSEALIIDRIRSTNSKFTLTAADINYLLGQGVTQNVIDAMQGK